MNGPQLDDNIEVGAYLLVFGVLFLCVGAVVLTSELVERAINRRAVADVPELDRRIRATVEDELGARGYEKHATSSSSSRKRGADK